MPNYTLGRIVNHDPRSRWHANPTDAVSVHIANVRWDRFSPILDQGDLGCCTGCAMTGWLGCYPHITSKAAGDRYNLEFAHKLYSRATQIDPFPGTWPPTDTGSSGLAVAKAAKELKEISKYQWAFSADGLAKALQTGPAIIGVPWFEGMFTPDRDGRIWPTGGIAGGHEILVRGIIGRDFLLSNSWGTSWGLKGECLLPMDAWSTLRRNQADVTIPVA